MSTPPTKPPLRRVAASVLIGTTIEWYDFQLYAAAAALVFAPLFFPSSDPVAGTLLAFSTFAVGFAARPLGGVIMGHFGDRLGRKQMLVLSLTMMGVATAIIGLLPTYSTVGVWAPILLVLLRLVQGFGVGGEWGGAVLTAVEHAPPNRRGLFGSLPQVGVPAGLFLSATAFLAVSQLPEEQFLSWGWRIPFVGSIVLVAIGLYIRLTLEETPSFARVRETKTVTKVPIVTAIKTYPKQMLLAVGSMISTGAYFYIANTYAITYATTSGKLTRGEILTAVLISAVVAAVSLPYFGHLGQRFGRRKMILIGLAATGLWIFSIFSAIDTGNIAIVIPTLAVGAVCLAIGYGPLATFISELFDARVRFSAASTTFQVGVLLGGALAPIIATALVAATGRSLYVALYVAALSVVSFVSVFLVISTDVERGSRDMDPVQKRDSSHIPI